MHASDAWLPKRRAGSATTHTSKLPSRCAPSRFGFPNPRSSLQSPVSQKMERAPYMDPEAMKPVRPRGCPRDRSDPTARVAHTPKSIFSPSFPERNYRPQARVARTMKLLPSFRLPDAPAPTSLHGAPAGELPLHPVSRTSKPRAIRGTRTAEPPRHPVSRAVKQPQLHGSPMFWSQRRRRGCPKHRHSPHPTGCSSCGTFVRRAVARTTTFGPTALIRSEADLFIRLPARRSRPHSRMPMLEALASRSFLREAFPRHTVTCVASGLRCDVVTA